MKIGNKVRKARENRGFSQEKMADILGIRNPNIANLKTIKHSLIETNYPYLPKH